MPASMTGCSMPSTSVSLVFMLCLLEWRNIDRSPVGSRDRAARHAAYRAPPTGPVTRSHEVGAVAAPGLAARAPLRQVRRGQHEQAGVGIEVAGVAVGHGGAWAARISVPSGWSGDSRDGWGSIERVGRLPGRRTARTAPVGLSPSARSAGAGGRGRPEAARDGDRHRRRSRRRRPRSSGRRRDAGGGDGRAPSDADRVSVLGRSSWARSPAGAPGPASPRRRHGTRPRRWPSGG